MQLNRGNEDPPLARVGTGERGECRGKQNSVLCDEVGAMMEKQLACSWTGAVRPTPCRGGDGGEGQRGVSRLDRRKLSLLQLGGGNNTNVAP